MLASHSYGDDHHHLRIIHYSCVHLLRTLDSHLLDEILMLGITLYFRSARNLYNSDLTDVKRMAKWIRDQFNVAYFYDDKEVKVQADQVVAWGYKKDSDCRDYIHVALPTESNIIMSRQEAENLRNCLTSLLEETK